MRTTIFKTTLGLALAMGLAASASAVMIDAATYGLYTINNGVPNNATDNLNYLGESISLWNANTASATALGNAFAKIPSAVGSPVPALASSPSFQKFDGVNSGLAWNLGSTPVDYLLIHFGGYSVSYYLGGLTGVVDIQDKEFPDLNPGNGGGISSVTEVFGGTPPPTVPDGGFTIVLCGAALSLVELLRRRLCR